MNFNKKNKLSEIRDLNVNSKWNSKHVKNLQAEAKVIKLQSNQDTSFKDHVRNISNHTKSF